MNASPYKQPDASQLEHASPELGERLRHIWQERDRCLRYAAVLSHWSQFWNTSLIAVGALVAAQGAFVKVWGNANWITISFIFFGAFTAAGTGFNMFFRPGERSPKFAQIGFKYEAVWRDIYREASALHRGSTLHHSRPSVEFHDAMDGVLRKAHEQLAAVRRRELDLYVTGPTTIGRQPRNSRKRQSAQIGNSQLSANGDLPSQLTHELCHN